MLIPATNDSGETHAAAAAPGMLSAAVMPAVLTLPAERQSVTQARAFARRRAEAAGFDADAVADIELAVGEAVSNAVIHGRSSSAAAASGGGIGTIAVRAEFSRSTLLTIEVYDNGPGFDPARVRQAAYADAEAQNGRGLMLMRALMHRVELLKSEAGMIVRMERRLQDAEPAPTHPAPPAAAV